MRLHVIIPKNLPKMEHCKLLMFLTINFLLMVRNIWDFKILFSYQGSLEFLKETLDNLCNLH